jgi:hypothetical protein
VRPPDPAVTAASLRPAHLAAPAPAVFNRCVSHPSRDDLPAAGPTDYRVAPALAARLTGVGLALVGGLVFATTLVVALLDWHTLVVIGVAVVGLLVVAALSVAVTRAAHVVRLDEEGYVVRFVRGAGVTRARWTEVEDAVTARVADADCVVLRLKDGRSTTIPVAVLAGSRDDFVRDVRSRLRTRRTRRG